MHPTNLTCAVKVLLGEVRERKHLDRDQRSADLEHRAEVVIAWTTNRICLCRPQTPRLPQLQGLE